MKNHETSELQPSTQPLTVRGLVKRFGDVTAVDHVELELGASELLALVGPSGCGKSTLLRSIAGLIDPDAGTIHLGGTVVDDGKRRLAPEHRSAGLVFQEHALFPHLTVFDNIGFGLRSLSGADKQRRVSEMLELVDLPGLGERYPHELSGGQRQRVSLARAMAPRPDIMLFDEPFASLDPNLRVQLRHQVTAVLRETKTPAVFVTHDQREALAMGDRIAVMRDGVIEQVGTAEEVFHRPVSQFVGAFMGEANFLPIVGEAGAETSPLGPIDLNGYERSSTVAMTRPDDVVFTPSESGPAVITGADYTGTHWLVRVELASGDQVQLLTSHLDDPTPGRRGELSLAPGHHQVPVPVR